LINASRALAAAPSDPDEIHVIHCPSEQSCAAYKADPRLAQLSGLKQQVLQINASLMGLTIPFD
jgi:hypothetical protein